jgi:hypothetical protein
MASMKKPKNNQIATGSPVAISYVGDFEFQFVVALGAPTIHNYKLQMINGGVVCGDLF